MTKRRPQHGGFREVYVSAVGGTVLIRAIPPKRMGDLMRRATRGGRVDFNELMALKVAHGVVEPNFTIGEAREVTRRWSLSTLQPIVDAIDQLCGTDDHIVAAAAAPKALRKIVRPTVLATVCMRRGYALQSVTRRPRERRGSHGCRRRTTSTRAGPSDEGDPEPVGTRPRPAGRQRGHHRERHGAPLLAVPPVFIPTWGGWRCPACSRRAAQERGADRQLTFADVFIRGTA